MPPAIISSPSSSSSSNRFAIKPKQAPICAANVRKSFDLFI
jgi:hypothetical protein